MASLCEQIIVAALEKVATVSGATVYRSRWTALSRAESPAIVVRPSTEEVVKRNNDLAERELLLLIEVVARGATPDSVADQYCVAAHNALMQDQTLGGKALLMRELGTVWEGLDADTDAVVVVRRYQINYRTPANALS